MFKKLSLLAIIVVFAGIFNSCDDSKTDSQYAEEKITKNNLYSLAQKLTEENKLSREDIQLFTGAINRLGLNADSIVGKTVAELISAQDEFAKQQEFKQMTSILAKAEIIVNHSIKYIGMKPLDTLEKSYDYLVFEITNKSDKEIANLMGQFRFLDANNNLIKAYPIELKQIIPANTTLKANETRRLVYPFFHDKNNQRDEIVRAGNGLQVVWFPTEMIYSDSTVISSIIK